MKVLLSFLDHIYMHLKAVRASEECCNGSGVSLHLQPAPASFQLNIHTYRSCGHFCFSYRWKILDRSKDLFWFLFYFFHLFICFISRLHPFSLFPSQSHHHNPPLPPQLIRGPAQVRRHSSWWRSGSVDCYGSSLDLYRGGSRRLGLEAEPDYSLQSMPLTNPPLRCHLLRVPPPSKQYSHLGTKCSDMWLFGLILCSHHNKSPRLMILLCPSIDFSGLEIHCLPWFLIFSTIIID